MRGSSSLPGGAWPIPLIAFAGVWEAVARLVQRPSLFPTFVETVSSLPSLFTAAMGWATLSSLVSAVISFTAAAVLAMAIGALLKQSTGSQSGSRIFIWLAIVFLSLSLTKLSFEGFGSGSNAVYVVGGGASFLLMAALLSSGLSGMVVLDIGLLVAWAGVLSAESVVGGQSLGVLVHSASQDATPERFYALCLVSALLGLVLVTVVESLAGRLNLMKGSGRR